MKAFLEAGRITGTHALKGDVRIEPWCDSAEFLCRFKRLYFQDGTEMKVIGARVHKSLAIIHFENIDRVEQADLLRGKVVYINRQDVRLPKGRYFIQDIIGLRVVDTENGTEYGTITDVLKTGANDVYQVSMNGKDYLMPVIPDVVVKTDIEGGLVTIHRIGGLFEDED